MFEAPALENTHQWHRSKQQIKTSHTPCRRTISHAPAPEARIRQQFKTNRSPLDTRFCTHAVYDSDDLTPCSINHKSLARANTPFPALFSGVRLRVYRSSSKSIRGKSMFLPECISVFGEDRLLPSRFSRKREAEENAKPLPLPPPPGAWCLVLKGREGGCSNISKLIRS